MTIPRTRGYALRIDAPVQTIINAIFDAAATDEKASAVAGAFRDAYARGEWTADGLTTAIERTVDAAGEGSS